MYTHQFKTCTIYSLTNWFASWQLPGRRQRSTVGSFYGGHTACLGILVFGITEYRYRLCVPQSAHTPIYFRKELYSHFENNYGDMMIIHCRGWGFATHLTERDPVVSGYLKFCYSQDTQSKQNNVY